MELSETLPRLHVSLPFQYFKQVEALLECRVDSTLQCCAGLTPKLCITWINFKVRMCYFIVVIPGRISGDQFSEGSVFLIRPF